MRTDKDTIAVRIALSVLFLVKNKRVPALGIAAVLGTKRNSL